MYHSNQAFWLQHNKVLEPMSSLTNPGNNPFVSSLWFFNPVLSPQYLLGAWKHVYQNFLICLDLPSKILLLWYYLHILAFKSFFVSKVLTFLWPHLPPMSWVPTVLAVLSFLFLSEAFCHFVLYQQNYCTFALPNFLCLNFGFLTMKTLHIRSRSFVIHSHK